MRSVRFKSNGTGIMGSSLVDLASGAELQGVTRVVASMEMDNYNTIEAVFIGAEIDVEGELRPKIIDPATGELREISRIVFADGSEWTA